MSIRIVLVDDEAMVRAGLRLILETQPDLEIVGEASDGRQAIEVARHERPDLVLMDIRTPRLDGIEATRSLVGAEPAPRVLILTTFDLNEYVYGALRAGASGFLLKESPPEQLIAAVHLVTTGDALVTPARTRRLIEEHVKPEPSRSAPSVEGLTARELDVLKLMAKGLSNGEIGERLNVSEATVRTHVGHVLSKLEARSRVQAVVLAYEAGVVRAGDSD